MSPEHHICSKANNAVEIKNLHKNYSGTRAISDLSLNIPAGSFFGLLGPNGSGKTSTLRILATLTSADSGEVLINGINVTNQPREVRKLIGYVGQTGLATGPHVCFRFWKNGEQVDHLREEFPPSNPIREEQQGPFAEAMSDWLEEMARRENEAATHLAATTP